MGMVMNKLRDLANEVGSGEQRRFVCPECGGGTHHEQSLVITKEGLTAHCRCWRASCSMGYKRVTSDGFIATPSTTSRPPRRTRWEGESTALCDWLTGFNLNFYNTDLPIRITPDGRAIIPILDREGIRRGDIIRQAKPYSDDYPKSLSLYDEGYDGMAWFYPADSKAEQPLCLVEDPISAMRLAASGVIGVALLGTLVTADRVTTLRQWARDNDGLPIHLALDADAYLFAIRQLKRLYNQLDIRVHSIFYDIKDMDSEELLNFLGVLGVYT
jgi:hypothetical protein